LTQSVYNEAQRPEGSPPMTLAYANAFLDEIVEQPDDDVPRLVYADWLEERGDADRAEFIRLQIDLARPAPDAPARRAALARERELLADRGAEWAADVAELVLAHEFRRGFVGWVRLDAARLLQHGDELFRLAPVRHLELFVERGQAVAVARCRHLARLAALDLSCPAGDPVGLRALVGSPHLAGLRSLRLRCLTGAAEAVAAAEYLSNLTALDLGANNLGHVGLGALLGARLPALTVLRLNSNALTDGQAQRLAGAPLLDGLTGLDLALNHISAPGLEALALSPRAARLRSLWLGFNHAGDAGARALAESGPTLERLYLGSNRLGLAGVVALARSQRLAGLTHLDLDYNELPAAALEELAASLSLGRLQALYLRCGRGLTRRARGLLERRFGAGTCRF
jgi:uncharacterized protein (TIGR02996 family)